MCTEIPQSPSPQYIEINRSDPLCARNETSWLKTIVAELMSGQIGSIKDGTIGPKTTDYQTFATLQGQMIFVHNASQPGVSTSQRLSLLPRVAFGLRDITNCDSNLPSANQNEDDYNAYQRGEILAHASGEEIHVSKYLFIMLSMLDYQIEAIQRQKQPLDTTNIEGLRERRELLQNNINQMRQNPKLSPTFYLEETIYYSKRDPFSHLPETCERISENYHRIQNLDEQTRNKLYDSILYNTYLTNTDLVLLYIEDSRELLDNYGVQTRFLTLAGGIGGSMGLEMINTVLDYVDKTQPIQSDIVSKIATAAGKLGGHEGVEILQLILNDYEYIRGDFKPLSLCSIASAAGKIGGTEGAEIIHRILAKKNDIRDSRSKVLSQIAISAGQMKGDRGSEILLALLKESNDFGDDEAKVYSNIAIEACRLGDKGGIAILQRLLNSNFDFGQYHEETLFFLAETIREMAILDAAIIFKSLLKVYVRNTINHLTHRLSTRSR